jgi:hypothetical protein
MITKKEITAKNVKNLILRVYIRYSKQLISGAEAYRETYVLNSLLKSIELTDLEDRLQLIENTLKNG